MKDSRQTLEEKVWDNERQRRTTLIIFSQSAVINLTHIHSSLKVIFNQSSENSSQSQPAVLLYEEGRERGWRREKGWAGMYGECQMSSIHGSRFQVVLWKLTASRFSVPTYGDSWEQRFEGCRLTSNIFYNADQSWLCLPWTQDVMGRKGGLNERRGRKLNKKRGEGSNDNLPERTKHMYITESEWFCCCISKNDIWDLEELNYKTTQSVFNYAFISKPDEVASRGPTAHRV